MNTYAPILLAEDDEGDIFIIRRALRAASIANPLHIVRNGQEAIQYLDGQGPYADRTKYPWPSLVLLDLRMPLADGFDVLAWLQRRRRPKDLDVVILSGTPDEADALRATELGADAFYVKPRAYEDLVGVVRGIHERLNEMPEIEPWLPTVRGEARL